MTDPVIVGAPPFRNNIKYLVKPMPDVSSFCSDIANSIKKEESYPKTVIFCRQYADCACRTISQATTLSWTLFYITHPLSRLSSVYSCRNVYSCFNSINEGESPHLILYTRWRTLSSSCHNSFWYGY